MNAWILGLIEAVTRLVEAIAGRAEPRNTAAECAAEITDYINQYAYQLENEDSEETTTWTGR